MKSFNGLKSGDKLRSIENDDILTVVIWRDEMYLAGKTDMWSTDEFDPRDWELLN